MLKLEYQNDSKIDFVTQEMFEVIKNDLFYLLKNLFKDPLALIYEDQNLNEVNEYIRNLLFNFNKTIKMVTTSLPLKSSKFNSTIDNELFEQFYRQIQIEKDKKSSKNSNYERELFINHYNRTNKLYQNESDFKFYIMFYKKTLIKTNLDNYPKLLINLLNVLII